MSFIQDDDPPTLIAAALLLVGILLFLLLALGTPHNHWQKLRRGGAEGEAPLSLNQGVGGG